MIRRIQLGRVTFEPLPPHSRLVQPENNAAPYLAALEELCRVLAAGTWALAGGLVVPICMGVFYRRHSDIDIVLPLAVLTEVVKAFNAAGYELYTSWSISHHARGILMEYRIKCNDGRVGSHARRLYVKHAGPVPVAPLLSKIDLYPYRMRGSALETCNTGTVLAHGAMQRSSLTPFNRPGHVNCLHLDNVAALKAVRSGPKHRLDCAVIRDGTKAARAWFDKPAASPGAAIGPPAACT